MPSGVGGASPTPGAPTCAGGCAFFFSSALPDASVSSSPRHCLSATSISAASAPAMGASPGRVTVHCWSSVRSRVESPGAITSLQK